MIDEWPFGKTPDDRTIQAYKIGSTEGLTAVVLNYGATLQALYLPDGRNIILGSETVDALLLDDAYMGRIIGRNANRIMDARLNIGDEAFDLTPTDGPHNLHSGPNGFDTKIWETSRQGDALVLKHTSIDGAQGFPGKVDATLRISVNNMTLRLEIEATTTRATPMNITWHPYWNLLGKGRIDGHDLQVSAEHRTTLKSCSNIDVADTRYDFQTPLALGSVRIDDNYVNVSKAVLSTLDTTLTVTSSLPDLQVYTGDHLPRPRSGVALEPQFRPNDINVNQDCLLQAGDVYRHWIEYKLDQI